MIVKKIAFDEIQAFAFGELGIAYSDFWQMTPREFSNACDGYNQRLKREYQTGWEQARWIGTLLYNKPVYGYKITAKSATSLFPFDWDTEETDHDFEEEKKKIKEYRKKWQEAQHIG